MDYRKSVPVALMGAIALGVGLSDRGVPATMGEAGGVTLVGTALIVALIYLWFRGDARGRGFSTSWGMNTSMVLVTTIALPWYLVRSRVGARARGKAMAGLAVTFILSMACYRVGAGP